MNWLNRWWPLFVVLLGGLALPVFLYLLFTDSIFPNGVFGLKFELHKIKDAKDALAACGTFLAFTGTFTLGYAVHLRNLGQARIDYEPKFDLTEAKLYWDVDDKTYDQQYDSIRLRRHHIRQKKLHCQFLHIKLKKMDEKKANLSRYRIDFLRLKVGDSSETFHYRIYRYRINRREQKPNGIWCEINLHCKQSFIDILPIVARADTSLGYELCEVKLRISYWLEDISPSKYTKTFNFNLVGDEQNSGLNLEELEIPS